MQDVRSSPWIRVAGLVTSLALAWAVLIPYGLPWVGLAWVSLACAGTFWLRTQSTRSIWQVIDDVEAEPAWAVAASRPAARPLPKTIV